MYKIMAALFCGVLLLIVVILVYQRDERIRFRDEFLKSGGHVVGIHVNRKGSIEHLSFDGRRYSDDSRCLDVQQKRQ